MKKQLLFCELASSGSSSSGRRGRQRRALRGGPAARAVRALQVVSQLVKVVQRVVGARGQVNFVATTAAVTSGDANGVGVAR